MFEESLRISPTKNDILISYFNSDERIQDLLKKRSLYGEMCGNDDLIDPTMIERFLTVDLMTAAIEIFSIREDDGKVKVSFDFLNTDYGDKARVMYTSHPQSFRLRARAIINPARDYKLYLVTFDLVYAPSFSHRVHQ